MICQNTVRLSMLSLALTLVVPAAYAFNPDWKVAALTSGIATAAWLKRKEIRETETAKNWAAALHISPYQLVNGSISSGIMLALAASAEHRISQIALGAAAIAPLALSITVPKETQQAVINNQTVQQIAKPLSLLPKVACSDEKCPGVCNKCKNHKLYAACYIPALALAGYLG